jgi:predicted O-methyltransferase YrrM
MGRISVHQSGKKGCQNASTSVPPVALFLDMNKGEELWAAVDHYVSQELMPADPVLEAALEDSDAAGLPAIQVTVCQGKLLQMLAQIHGARRILEIGTLAGYSTIWLARALPADGHLITLEVSQEHARVARDNLARARLLKLVELRVGPALDTLPQLQAERQEPFDLIFIDADKVGTPEYFLWALKLSRRGSLIIVDNVVRKGELAAAASSDPSVQAMRRLIHLLGKESRVAGTVIQTVGSKGYDGFAMALVTG